MTSAPRRSAAAAWNLWSPGDFAAAISRWPIEASEKLQISSIRKFRFGNSLERATLNVEPRECLNSQAMRLSQRVFTQRISRRGIPAPRKDIYGPKTRLLFGNPTINSRTYSTALDGSRHWPTEFAPTRLELKSHPLGWEAIQGRVEPSFEQNWEFTSDREREGFLALGLSRAFSEWYPLILDDRVELTGKIHYLVILIDGENLKSLPCLNTL